MCIGDYLPVQPHNTDRNSYCESCLTAAQELEKGINDAPAASRQAVIEKLLSRRLCEKLEDVSKSACMHLLDSNRDKFRTYLLKEVPKNLDIMLCYEVSHACIGVKRQAFQDSKPTFTDAEIAALLRDNKENVRVAHPTHEALPEQRRNEL